MVKKLLQCKQVPVEKEIQNDMKHRKRLRKAFGATVKAS